MKYLVLGAVVLGFIAGAAYIGYGGLPSSPLPENAPKSEIRLSPRQQMSPEQAALIRENPYATEVEQRLAKFAAGLRELVQDPVILQGVRDANGKDKMRSMEEITALDEDWIGTKTLTPFITSFLTNQIAQRLLVFQKENPGFKELFIADAYGLNVAETDKTSDYYQADESWWVNAMNRGAGKLLHGNIEFDQSSQTEAIAFYVPVSDPESKRAIGVLKAVLDVSTLGKSL